MGRSSARAWFSRSPRKMKARRLFGFSLSLILINMAAIMERADENLLPSVYKEVSETFNAGPTDLGYLTFIRNFVQALSSPLAGILVLHYDRPSVLAMGTTIWALSTAAVGASQHFRQVAYWRALNGFGLAIVIPALQSFIADSYKDSVRGTGFGLLSLVGSVGGIGGGVLATIMAGQEYWGIPGWRCAFIMMAVLSLLIGVLVYSFVDDPGRSKRIASVTDGDSERANLVGKGNAVSPSIWRDSWTAMRSVIKVQTFQVIVLQGIVGSLPTFLNMDVDLGSWSILDLCYNGCWDYVKLEHLFGPNLNLFTANLGNIDLSANNHYIWASTTSITGLSARVYHFLQKDYCCADDWVGWNSLWDLRIAPRVKYFLWLVFKGRLNSSEHLYSIRLGPRRNCPLCNLFLETAEHLLFSCRVATLIWNNICSNLNVPMLSGFCNGNWLVCSDYTPFAKAVFASNAWFLWKNRCDKIFRDSSTSPAVIAARALAHARNFRFANFNPVGRKLLLPNFSPSDSPILLAASCWTATSEVSGIGFVCLDTNCNFLMAGACPVAAHSALEADLIAGSLALHSAANVGLSISTLCTINPAVSRAFWLNGDSDAQLLTWILHIRNLLGGPDPRCIQVIPQAWSAPATSLASHALCLHALTLYFQGRELPRWIMRIFRSFGLGF